jgi:cellobiose phosphorylase
MQYGYFADDQREYVITRPDTPLPWINYLGSEQYFGLISNTAGGYSFYRDARLRRITRYRYNNVPYDSGGRYVYLRDNTSDDYWSPTWQPTRRDLQEYACRHGIGYTTISSRYQDITANIRYFVPMGENLEIWQVTLTNQRSQTADLSLFSCVEFCLWEAWDDSTNFQRNFNIGEVEVEDNTIYHKTEYRERRNHFAYFSCSAEMAGFDTQRDDFLGAYNGWDNPAVVVNGEANNSIAYGWAPIGSHHVRLTLQPGEQRQIVFVLGYHENADAEKFDPVGSQVLNKRTVLPTINHYLDEHKINSAFAELRQNWSSLLNVYQVQTPDQHTNRMVNIWNAYQNMVTFNMSRSASFFESGIGRGMGYRDSNQDLLGFVHMIPERARERILDLAATQLETGGAYHQYQPLTKRGNDAVGGNFNDDPLWLILSTVAYVKETGDFSILSEEVPYDNRPGTETSLYEHLQRSLQYTVDRLGPHGLPLIGRADWNDCLNLNAFSNEPGESFQTTTNKDGKVAESLFIAGLFVLAANEMAELADANSQPEDGAKYRDLANTMTTVTLQYGWDGDWFLRAYDDNGHKVGSRENNEGQLFIEPQGMCIMAGIGKKDRRAKAALNSVRQRLATPHGIVLHQPAFTQYYLHLGEISTYPPGYKENAGIFCHTNPWIMIAETVVDNGDQAFDYYQRINPSVREAISEQHRSEPYVYAQMIAGRDAATFGEAKNSWLSGTAAWNYVAITQWILGIRPSYHGLVIAPVVPQDWSEYSVTRRFRNITYEIHITRIGPGNESALIVDGKPLKGNVVPIPPDSQSKVMVDVKLGRPSGA